METIGDAYMVSSGIPISNPEHAQELADMALTLCHGVTKFKVTNASDVFNYMIGVSVQSTMLYMSMVDSRRLLIVQTAR